MLRSMLSAASAIRNHQTYMDVVANNIANVNTTAFKSMRVTFQELMTQVLSAGAPPSDFRGGINPIQIGLGMNLSGVGSVFTQGALQNTGRTSDLAIQGNGFFVFQGAGGNLYSRDGSLDLGLDGSLLNPSTGLRILGWNAVDGVIDPTGELQPVMIPLNQGLAQATRNVRISGNVNAQLVARSVANSQVVADTVDAFAAVNPAGGSEPELATGDYFVEVREDPLSPGDYQFRVVDSAGTAVRILDGGAGTDYTAEWQDISAGDFDTGRGLQITFGAGPYTAGVKGAGAASVRYNSQSMTTNVQVYDSLGAVHTLTISLTKDDATPNRWVWQVTSNDPSIVTLNPATASPINFSQTGQYLNTNPAATIAMTFNNGAANQTINLDMLQLTQLAQQSDLGVPVQDGYAPGRLIGFNVAPDGSVECNYANGMRNVVSQIAIAEFMNPSGLLRMGENMFAPSTNSGVAGVGVAGANGRGMIQAGYLEGANVDLALQFTSMISAQRGFQANSRVISASDQMLQDLVNLVR